MPEIRVIPPGVTGQDLMGRRGWRPPKLDLEGWLARRGAWYTVEPNGCWQWRRALSGGQRNRAGYGVLFVNGRRVAAHRYAFELMRRPIPKGLCINHICENRACVNPDHMELVTPGVNVLMGRGPSAKRLGAKTCPNGHPYRPETTYITPSTGWRRCLICRALREK